MSTPTVPSDVIQIRDPVLRAGFAQLPRTVLRARGLSDRAKVVYALLLDYAWQRGSCFPGQKRLAEDLGATERTVQRALTELRAYGLVAWKRRGMTQTNVYFLLSLTANPRLRPRTGEATTLPDPEATMLSPLEATETSHEGDSGLIDPELKTSKFEIRN